MKSESPWSRIVKAFRKERDLTQGELGQAIGVEQPTISRWERGSEPKSSHWKAFQDFARSVGADVPDLWGHDSEPHPGVPIVGYVGAGAAVYAFEETRAAHDFAPSPPEAADTTVAVQVRGDSLMPHIEDGWLLYYDDRRAPVTDDLVGELCVVGLPDGRTLVKRIYRNKSPGLWDLHSSNAPNEYGVAIEWAAKVTWIKPR